MQEAAGREPFPQAADQPIGELALARTDRVGVPFARFEVVDRDEGRLSAHRQADVARDERPVDLLAEPVERRPRLFREGLGDARMLRHALDPHVEREVDVGEAGDAGDRRGVAVMRRGGERDVAFAGQKPGGRIEADPAGAGKIDLGPGVKIGEVMIRSRRPVERDEVRLELDQVARDEAPGQSEMTENLHQEPARIAARAGAALEGLLRALHARLHPDEVFYLARETPVEIDDKIDRAARRAVDPVEKGLKPRAGGLRGAVDDEIGSEILAIFERPGLRAFLDEEIEWIVHRHVGDDVDLDLQFVDEFGEDVSCEPVAVRILLHVHEMIGGRDFQRMRDHTGAAVRRRLEADDLRPERHRPVVFVMGQMVDRGSNGHGAEADLVMEWRRLSQFAAPHNQTCRTVDGPRPVGACGAQFPRDEVRPPDGFAEPFASKIAAVDYPS